MLLHGSVIKYELSKKMSCSYKVFSQDIEVDLPLFYEEGLNMSGHIVLIDSSERIQIVHNKEDVIFVCHNRFAKNILNSTINLIIIEDNVPMTIIFNQIMQIFLRFNEWEKIMIDNISNFATFDKMFDNLEMVVDQGVFLADTQFHFISYTKKYIPEFPDLNIDQALQMIVKQGFSTLDSIKEVFQYNEIEHCLHKNIFFHNSYVGRLGTWYSEDEDKNKYYTHLLDYLAKYLEELYSISGSFERNAGSTQLLKEVFRNFINGVRVDAYTLLTTLSQNHYHQDDEYFLINFTTNIKGESHLYANYIGTQMERKWQGICCIQNEIYTLILVNITVFKKFETVNFFQELPTLIRDSMLIAAISRRFRELQNVYQAFNQTKIAFEIGKKIKPNYWLYKFDDYTLDYLLHSAKGDFSPEQICSTVILKIKEYDNKNHTQHFETLFEYIKNQYNASATANALFIARSTFLSRMEQITKLTNLDLNDWNVRLYLMLSYKFYEI
ncbi:PucR family transcriptional regulator [Dehalobacter sp. TBBPA1]|uniref:PucR family transcriptional regulator n=1 Tax=Dehalobacter sp. TBBPA1 TaxID=3235037 RepID=UPI0034A2DA0D